VNYVLYTYDQKYVDWDKIYPNFGYLDFNNSKMKEKQIDNISISSSGVGSGIVNQNSESFVFLKNQSFEMPLPACASSNPPCPIMPMPPVKYKKGQVVLGQIVKNTVTSEPPSYVYVGAFKIPYGGRAEAIIKKHNVAPSDTNPTTRSAGFFTTKNILIGSALIIGTVLLINKLK